MSAHELKGFHIINTVFKSGRLRNNTHCPARSRFTRKLNNTSILSLTKKKMMQKKKNDFMLQLPHKKNKETKSVRLKYVLSSVRKGNTKT